MNRFKIVGIIVILAISVLFLASSIYLDSIVKGGIQKYGPQILQVPVSVESVSLSPMTGSGTVEGLIIGNPEGFESDYLINIGLLSVDIDVNTLLSDHIIIENLKLQDMHVIYERNSGTTNVAAFEKLMAEEASSGAEVQTMTIDQALIEESRVTLQASLLGGKSVTVKIPRIEQEQLSSNDATVERTVKMALKLVLNSVKNVGTKAIQKPGDINLRDKVKGIFNNN